MVWAALPWGVLSDGASGRHYEGCPHYPTTEYIRTDEQQIQSPIPISDQQKPDKTKHKDQFNSREGNPLQ